MSAPVDEQVLKDIKPETRHAIVYVFEDRDIWQLVLTKALENFTEIEGLSFFIKLSVAWKAFNRVFLQNDDVLWHLYHAYFYRTGIPKYPPTENYKNAPHYPDITMKRSFGFPPENWKTPEVMGELDRKYFFATARKILVLAYTPWCSNCHTPRIIGKTKSFPIWRSKERLCDKCMKYKFTSNRELLREYDFSIVGSKCRGKRDVCKELRDSMSSVYFSLRSNVQNDVLLNLSKNEIDFVEGREASKKNSHGNVLMFWVGDLNRLLSTEKIIYWGDLKKKAINTIGSYFRMKQYRSIVNEAFKGMRTHKYLEKLDDGNAAVAAATATAADGNPPPAKKMKKYRAIVDVEREPIIFVEWITMDFPQREWVLAQLEKRVTYFKLRPDPEKRFIGVQAKYETTAYNRLWRTVMNGANKFYDWDADNIDPRIKRIQNPPAP